MPIRVYRATITTVLSGMATLTTAMGTMDPATLTVFGPCLLAAILGWPWWHHLRTRYVDTVDVAEVDESLTAKWAQLWRDEIEPETLPKTTLTKAHSPRAGVIEATIRLWRGAKQTTVLHSGIDLETALFLDRGSVGWRLTSKTAIMRLVIVEGSYIARGVPWSGPTYNGGRIDIAMFADGTPGHWVAYRPGFGTLNGLVVGSTGAGKTRALGVIIANLIAGGWAVIIGDCQNGQSLPAWRDAVSEYHQGVDAVRNLLFRVHDEVMERSELLSAHGVDTYDDKDPRVLALGLKKLAVIIDECQLVLIRNDRELVKIVEIIVAICRKTGVSLIFGTQIPQLSGLAGSMALRDALVAGNAVALRLSNSGSERTILPSDFVGDPFAIKKEDENGKTTAGMGYLRDAPQQGMLCRIYLMDEKNVAASLNAAPVDWNVDPIDQDAEKPKRTTTTSGEGVGSAADRMRERFGLNDQPTSPEPRNAKEWILTCLGQAPMGAKALIQRPDCPVNQAQIYVALNQLVDAGRVMKPADRGGQYTIS